MTKDLDAKLRQVLDTANMSTGIGIDEETYIEAIAQIKAAFSEAGYATREEALSTALGDKLDGGFMTGQEWLDRFNHELKFLISRGDGETWMGYECGEVREVARRAANLDTKEEK